MPSTASFSQILSRILFWNYARGTWQYDVACGLILVFIFLTPKSVFDGSFFSEWRRSQEVQEPEQRAGEELSAPRSRGAWSRWEGSGGFPAGSQPGFGSPRVLW